MKREFRMPKLGLTMTEGLLAEWLLAPGRSFVKDQVLFVIETDKAANEVTADSAGVVLEILTVVGETVPVGHVIGYWDDLEGEYEAGPAVLAPAVEPVDVPAPSTASTEASTEAPTGNPAGSGARIVATPLARRLARRDGVDLSRLHGSGPGGRIKAGDLPAASVEVTGSTAIEARPAGRPGRRVTPGATQASAARRLAAAKRDVPHFYLALEADVAALTSLRADIHSAGGAKVTLNDFIVAALGRALVQTPSANRVWLEGDMLEFDSPDVGVAVHTARGLFVPVVRDAGHLSLAEVARETRALVERARAGRLGAAEMSGGAVTVSNAGMFNVTYMTPIITPGQAMTLGVGSVRKIFRPDAQGQPALRLEMGMVLACDHRVLDGVSGLQFLHRVVACLEQPRELLASAPPTPAPAGG